MIDIHTHLLPHWDDGAKDWDEVSRMCEVALRDGIKKMALTPHIFRMNKYSDDLGVLKERWTQFQERENGAPIKFYRGAEVFVHYEMVESIKKNNFTLNNSNYIFIEFPSDYILPGVKDLFFRLMLEGYVPIISHPERNSVFGKKPDLLYELIQMGGLAQLTAKSIAGEFGNEIRKNSRIFLENDLVHLIASDAHDSKRRPPKLSQGVEEAGKIVGEEKALAMVTSVPEAILENKSIPGWRAPRNPVRKNKWSVRIPKLFRQ